MAREILLVVPDSDTEELLWGLVEKNLAQTADMPIRTCEDNEADARKRMTDRRYDLLITEDRIPADRKSSLVEEEMRGLELLKYAREKQPHLPGIVYTRASTERLRVALMDFDKCTLVVAGQLLEEAFRKCLARVFGASAPRESVIDVEIYLREPAICSYCIRERGQAPPRFNSMVINEDEFRQLVLESDELEDLKDDKWRRKLWNIGERLLNDLKGNPKFAQDFYSTTRSEIRKCRFIFDIDRRFHPIALEAIVEHGAEDFWMLQAPVIRRVNLEQPIFMSGGGEDSPINCLILESNVDGYARKDFPKFGWLDNVPDEAEWLERFLKHEGEVKPTVPIGKVVRIAEKTVPKGKSFRECVQETLEQEGPWHLVHFAGHSYYDKEKEQKRGYVIFPAPPSGKSTPEAVDIEVFAEWLRENRTHLVYMSSCHSSDSNIVFELARNYVPTIVGFRWDIADPNAVEHACAFYTHLLTGSPSIRIEHAFLTARKESYRKSMTNKTWAAPMLIRQILD